MRYRITMLLLIAGVLFRGAVAEQHEVEKYSFGFRNFKSDNDGLDCSKDITWEEYRNAYIAVPQAASYDNLDYFVFDTLVRPKFFRDGHCFGMSLLSLLVVRNGGHLGVCPPPLQYSGDLDKTCKAKSGVLYASGPTDDHVRSVLHEMHFHQFNLAAMRYYLDLLLNGGRARNGMFAYNQLQSECPAVISASLEVGRGHAMLAYKTEKSPGGTYPYKIFLYDNNFPWAKWSTNYKNNEFVINIVDSAGNWTYKSPDKDWSGGPGSGHLVVFPRSVIEQKDRSVAGLGALGTINQAATIVFMSGSGSDVEQVTDDRGRRLFRPGTRQLDLDPGTGLTTVAPYALSDSDGAALYYVRDDQDWPLDFDVRAGADGYQLIAGNAQGFVTIRAHGGLGTDRVRLRDTGTPRPSVVLYNTAEARTYDVRFTQILQVGGETRVLAVNSLTLASRTPLELAVEASQSRLKVTSPLANASFNVEIARLGGKIEGRGESRNVRIAAGESAVFSPQSWVGVGRLELVRRKEPFSPARLESLLKGSAVLLVFPRTAARKPG